MGTPAADQCSGAAAVELLVEGRYVYPLPGRPEVLPGTAVAVAGDRIAAIGPTAELRERFPTARRLIAADGLIMPGLVNVHTHAALACCRGLPLPPRQQACIFPAEARLAGDLVYSSTLLSIAEMIRSGTTSFCGIDPFAREVARAAVASGMRAWVGEALHDFPISRPATIEAGMDRVEDLLAEYRRHPLVTVTVASHAGTTCTPELLTKLKRLADRHNARFIMHLTDNEGDIRPVAFPAHHDVLDARTVAAHCVGLTEEAIEILAARDVKVAHCPANSIAAGCDIAWVVQLLKAGVTVGVGTDGSAGHRDPDMFREMGTAAKAHKLQHMDPTVMTAPEVLRMATLDGAEVLGGAAAIGSLEVGKKADLIVLDLAQPHLTPLYHVPSHLVYAAKGADVIHAVINGRVVMENRRLLTIDEQAVLTQARAVAEQVRSRVDRP